MPSATIFAPPLHANTLRRNNLHQAHMLQSKPPLRHNPFSDPSVDSNAHTFGLLLNAGTTVDESQLRLASASGIPSHQRAHVWKLLLGIGAFDKSHHISLELNRMHQYLALSNTVDADGDIPTRIRRLLKRSRTIYQHRSLHDKRYGRQGSTSGDSLEDDEDDDASTDAPISTTSVAPPNGRTMNYVRPVRHTTIRIIDREVQSRFTRILTTYLQRTSTDIEFDNLMVYLSAPFIELMPTEADAFYAFNALMQSHQHLFTDDGLREAVSEFNLMFRTLHPTLYEKFILEEVDINLFVRNWLRGLLVQQLPRRSLLRLWDSYFANLRNDGLHLHPFVCLVFIEHIKPELEECDDAERITTLLAKLPSIDIDHVIVHAVSTREQLREQGIVS